MIKKRTRLTALRAALVMALLIALTTPCVAARAAVPLTLMQGAPKQDAWVRAKALYLCSQKTLKLGAEGQGESAQLLTAVKPDGVSGNLTWSSSKPSVASVDQDGVVTAHKLGTATITCRTADGSKLKRTCRVTVKAVVPQSVAILTSSVNVAPNGAVQLSYEISPANAYNQKVTWKSSNPKVAKVSQAGVVTGVAAGKATITLTTKSGARKAKCTVNVCFADSNIYYVAIGQDQYQGQRPLPASVYDARRFERTLLASDFGQKSISGDVHLNLTGAQLRSVLAALPQTYGMTKNDITYVYYSGHGADSFLKSQRGALVGVDSAFVTVDEMRALLDKVPGTVVVVIDSCLSGQFITPKGTASNSTATAKDALEFEQGIIDAFSAPATSKGLNSLINGNANKSKYKIAVACKPMQESYAMGDYSVFTLYLCEAAGILDDSFRDIGYLPGDANKNGYLSLKEAYNYANPRAVRWCKAIGEKPQDMMVWPANDNFPIFARVRG